MRKKAYVRRAPQKAETISALAVSTLIAAGIGAVTFYLTRTLLARDVVLERGDDEAADELLP